MNQGKKKSAGDYGHDDSEWGLKDDSEKIEWEEYYKTRNRKGVEGEKDEDRQQN